MRAICCLLVSFLFLEIGLAQDAHYWSTDFGTGGFFMPGSVIANNKDSGLYFYNPALLGMNHQTSISISASIYQYEAIKIPNGVGTGRSLNTTTIRAVPQMLTGSFFIKKNKKPLVIAYALIRDPGLAYSVSQRRDEQFNVLNDSYSPGPEFFVGQFVQQNLVGQSSAQVSSGLQLSSKFSIGLTLEGDMHKQNFNINYSARALVNPGGDTTFPIVNVEEYYLATYSHFGFRAKLGLSYDDGPHHFGLIAYSPLWHIGGSATIVGDEVINNLQYSGQDVFLNQLASARQTGVPVRWKMPVSIGLGYLYEFSGGQIYVAAEYFAKIGTYNIITPRDDYFIRPDTGTANQHTTALLTLQDERKAVLNVALGTSFLITPMVTGYVSARTDFSYAVRSLFETSQGFTNYTSYWNNLHWQLGANLRKSSYNLRAGLLFAYGSTDQFPQPVNLDDPSDTNALLGTTGNTRARHFSLGLMFTFMHNF